MERVRKLNNYLSSYWFIILYGCVLYVTIKTGKLPQYENPSPRDIIIGFTNYCFWPFNYIFSSLVLGIILNGRYIYNCLRYTKQPIDFSAKFFMVSLLLFVIHITADPFGFVEWFVD